MADLSISIGADYKLDGNVTYFEAYMFMTTPKHIKEHYQPMEGESVIVNGNKQIVMNPLYDLDIRKQSLDMFNNWVKSRIATFPAPDGLSCCMIDFMPSDEYGPDCTMQEYQMGYERLKKLYMKFMVTHNRVAAMVQHWCQGRRYPHVHILYEKDGTLDSEFQSWLSKMWIR